MERSSFSLKWLEAFQTVARTGSVRRAAAELGISVSTVSHHLSCLEDSVGRSLLDHGTRPMRLTSEGTILLRRVDEALHALRKGATEVWADDPAALARMVNIAWIEDLDADIGPAYASSLSATLRSCSFSFFSRASHQILDMLTSREIDCGIAASSDVAGHRLFETPLLRDPYVLVTPRGHGLTAQDYVVGTAGLPFLRYSRLQIVSRRIDAQFRRLGLSPQGRLEFDSTRSLLSIVAAGEGWTVTTALGFASARRHHDQLCLLPFPGRAFARQVSMYRGSDVPANLFSVVLAGLKPLLDTHAVHPTVQLAPWLEDAFHTLDLPDEQTQAIVD